MRVLITQTYPTANRLAQKMRTEGHTPIVCPLLYVHTLDAPPPQTKWDSIIVLSQHAVFAFAKWQLQAKHYFAVGPATASAMVDQGLPTPLVPESWSSEGLLAHPMLQAVKDQSILILCGAHSLSILADDLHIKGAKVYKHPVYRIAPCDKVDEHSLYKAIAAQKGLDCISIASVAALEHLLSMMEVWPPAWTHNVVWQVPSERIANVLKAKTKHPVHIDVQTEITAAL